MKDNHSIDNRILVERCRKGDKEAMNLLYTRFAPRMLSLIQRYVDDPNDAQDILHDGFIIAFTRLESLRDSDRVDYWLATIMRNLSLKFLKSRDVALLMDELPDIEDPQLIENVLDFDVLTSLVDSLPTGYKNVFRLAVYENKSHKEISQILGIAPNSSSSQLFRAKLQLRQLINNYKSRAGMLVLILALGGVPAIYYIATSNSGEEKHTLSLSHLNSSSSIPDTQDETNSPINKIPTTIVSPSINPIGKSNRIANNIGGHNNVRSNKNVKQISESMPISTDSCSAKEELLKDSAVNYTPVDINTVNLSENTHVEDKDSLRSQNEYDLLYADLDYPLPISESSFDNRWITSFSVNTGFSNSDLLANNNNPGGNNNGNGNNNSNGDNNGPGGWNPNNPGYEIDDPGNPDDNDNDDNDDNRKKLISSSGKGDTSMKTPLKNQSHRNHLPISFAITSQKNFNAGFGIETGLNYTYLHTTFENKGFVTECHWHYIGIPLKVNLSLYNVNRLRIYSSFGGSFYYPVYSTANEKWMAPSLRTGSFHSHPIWSIGAGVGVSINLTKRIDLYLEPTIQYYFPNKDDVPNLWKDESWGFSLPIGVRFKW